MGWEARNGQQINRQPFAISPESAEILKKRGGVSVVLHTRFFRETPQEFISALESQGVSVTVHKLEGKLSDEKNVTMFNSLQSPETPRTILVLSELVDNFWQNGEFPGQLQVLGMNKNVAIIPLIHRFRWDRTIIGESDRGYVEAVSKRQTKDGLTTNQKLKFRHPDEWLDEILPKAILPIPTVDFDSFDRYVQLLETHKGKVAAVSFDPEQMRKEYDYNKAEEKIQPEATLKNKLGLISSSFDPSRRRFIAVMAGLPITQSVIEAVREKVFPEISESDFVEILYSGFLEQVTPWKQGEIFDFREVSGGSVRDTILRDPVSSLHLYAEKFDKQLLLDALQIAGKVFSQEFSGGTVFAKLAAGDFSDLHITKDTPLPVKEFAKVAVAVWEQFALDENRLYTLRLLKHAIIGSEEKIVSLDTPTRRINVEETSKDYGVTFLRKMLRIDPNALTTFEDLKQFDGFDEALKAMGFFLLDNRGSNGKIENMTIRRMFQEHPSYGSVLQWENNGNTYKLDLEYFDEGSRANKEDPAKIRLEVTGAQSQHHPLFIYDHIYKFFYGEHAGTSFGGVSNGQERGGFNIKHGYNDTVSIETMDNNKDPKQVSKQIATIMQQTAKILLDRYTEVTGQKQIDSPTITEI